MITRDNKKKLNLNKYSFLLYLKANFYCWINNNQNYLNLSKKYPELINLSPWRWKDLNKEKIKDLERPGTILDGLDASKWSRAYMKNIFPKLKVIDLEDHHQYNYKNPQKLIEYTKNLIENDDNFILFEGLFSYHDFNIRTDIIVKNSGMIRVLELKASTYPQDYHALDIMFQYKILEKLGYPVSKWNFRLLTLNGFFQYYSHLDLNKQAASLFVEWDGYFKTKPKELDYKIWNEKIRPLEEIMYLEDYFLAFQRFDKTLEEIKAIQRLDLPQKEILEDRNFKLLKNDYEQFFLNWNNVPKENSVFEFSGDSWFTRGKKAALFNQGFKLISQVDNKWLLSTKNIEKLSQKSKKIIFNPNLNDDLFIIKDKALQNDFLNNSKSLKRIIQKNSLIHNSTFLLRDPIINHLNSYQKVIYMFDFETVQNAIPKVNETFTYEQVPYQYSIHVILDKDDFDFKTMHNVVHLEWLATKKDFYNDFWKNFINDIQKYGKGSYVSFNKAFENKIIKNRIEKSNDHKEIEFLKRLRLETIDLMDPFANKWYYHKDLKGRYSIKSIGPHFAPEIDYKKLDKRVQKGDQSAKQCKIWLIKDNEEYDREWEQIRPAMLEYCKYDTLLMVVIFQKLLKLLQ